MLKMLKLFRNHNKALRNIKYFCEKLQEKRLDEYTYFDLKQLLNKAEEEILDGTYFLDSIPDNNYFGEVPIYIAPQGVFNNVRGSEMTSVLFISTLTSLAYFKIIFTHWLLFPYFSILTFFTARRFQNKSNLQHKYILRISLVDENKVRIIYYNGVSEDVNIRNICVNQSFLNGLGKFLEKKKNKNNATAESNNLNKNLSVAITIDTFKSCTLVLRNSDTTPGKPKADNLAYIDTKMLFGILCKQTKKLSLK